MRRSMLFLPGNTPNMIINGDSLGAAFGNDNYNAMADYMAKPEEAAKPFHLRIEGPMTAKSRCSR